MRFTKMQGVGNDFVVVDGGELPPHVLLPALAVQTCDRKFGIGADGLLVVSRDAPGAGLSDADVQPGRLGGHVRERPALRLAVCPAGWTGWPGRTEFTVAVKGGSRRVRLLSVAEDGRTATLGVDMGVPRFAPDGSLAPPLRSTRQGCGSSATAVGNRGRDVSHHRRQHGQHRTRSSSALSRRTRRRFSAFRPSSRTTPCSRSGPAFCGRRRKATAPSRSASGSAARVRRWAAARAPARSASRRRSTRLWAWAR